MSAQVRAVERDLFGGWTPPPTPEEGGEAREKPHPPEGDPGCVCVTYGAPGPEARRHRDRGMRMGGGGWGLTTRRGPGAVPPV